MRDAITKTPPHHFNPTLPKWIPWKFIKADFLKIRNPFLAFSFKSFSNRGWHPGHVSWDPAVAVPKIWDAGFRDSLLRDCPRDERNSRVPISDFMKCLKLQTVCVKVIVYYFSGSQNLMSNPISRIFYRDFHFKVNQRKK